MPETELSALRAEFVGQLEAGTLPSAYLDGYRRSGWDAPAVKIAFSQFLAARFLPSEEESFNATAKTEEQDYASLRDELAGLEAPTARR